MSEPRRLPPIWLMGLTNSLFGLMGGFTVVTVPEMLAAQGVPGGHIAVITAVSMSPAFWAFVLSPMLDVRFSRRTYAIAFGAMAAAAAGFTVFDHRNPLPVELVMVAGYVAASFYQGAVGGWTGSLISKQQDSELGMWFAVANTGASGFMILLAGGVVQRLSPTAAACIVAGGMMAPMLLFFAIPAPGPDRRLARESFGRFWTEVASLVTRREVQIALVLFLLPCASFSLTNVLGGVGKDFGASENVVSLFAGAGAVAAGLLGSFLLHPLARRFALRPLYLGVGITGGMFTLSLLALPRAPWCFGLAITGENMFQALSFATGNAITFEVIGPGNPLAATLFTLLMAAANLPIFYMGIIDGHGYDWNGITGSFLADAGISIAVCALLGWTLRSRLRAAKAEEGPGEQVRESAD
jgi:PAT family beta-lactamase induction signal transducer AmpG